jgi:N-acetylglucosaminyldiphosphoundecaprenol N-acetyl-beta-D-mannosaminyltransferase
MAKNQDYPYLTILGANINLVQIQDVADCVSAWIVKKEYSNYIVIANANDIVASKKDVRVMESMNNSSLTVPDGISLVLYARISGKYLRKRVYGPDLMLELLKSSESMGYSHFFYGATQETLNQLTGNLRRKFPGLKVVGMYAPPFSALNRQENERIAAFINNASPDFLWIGLGCPKQQLWMYENRDKIHVPVMIGVGAAFDFLAGTKPQAPQWLRDNGFEWLFRLIIEPKRMWRRYLIDYPLFVYFIILDLLHIPSSHFKNKSLRV